MFSLTQIEQQIAALKGAAEQIEATAAKRDEIAAAVYRSHADGLRVAVRSLELMVDRQIETEFRDAMERGVA